LDLNNNAIVIDVIAIQRFSEAMKADVRVPVSIVEEYRRRGSLPLPAENRPPYAPYRKLNAVGTPAPEGRGRAEGYEFSWGHILERYIDRFIVWEFCLDRLLQRYHAANLSLLDLQRVAFDALERHGAPVERDWLLALHVLDARPPLQGFGVFPGGAVSAFCVVAHFCRELEARHWVATALIRHILPRVLDAAIRHVETA
jgi:hypothetical protein